MYFISVLLSIPDRREIAGERQRSSRKANKVSLLPPQSAHLFAAGMRGPTGMQRGLREAQLHPTAVRLSGTLQGSLQRVPGR